MYLGLDGSGQQVARQSDGQYGQPVRSEVIIPVRVEGGQGSNRVPASQQGRAPTPPIYSGASIPSRSFRALQAMTGENDGNGGYSSPGVEARY